MEAFWKAFVIVFISEMGDKTQVVSFAFGSQYGLPTVLLGVFLAIAGLMLATVGLGNIASQLLPLFWINVASGVLFILFGLWALRKHADSDEKPVGEKFGALMAVMCTFFLAELGDKTVLASMTVASQQHAYWPVWMGSTLGMYLADVIAIVCGRVLGKQLPEPVLRYGSATIFIGAGLWTLVDTIMHSHP